uniref:Ribosomal protein n=1 Tax=Diabrotica virgifera virgifera TaxID=50390 RepID=A0A6P7F7M6_DIAVI
MFPILVNSVITLSKRIPSFTKASFSQLSTPIASSIIQSTFLKPVSLNVVPSCGFKIVGRVKRRCKDCFMVMREQRMYNLCKTHPRHKQMSMAKDPKNTWILTHATQSKVRPW